MVNLINHLISESLPKVDSEYLYSNSDPLTGQAAWFDLRVNITKLKPNEKREIYPSFELTEKPPGMGSPPKILRYGSIFRENRGRSAT